MFFRPPEYLEDVRERELEIKAMEDSLDVAERCPVCRAVIDSTFLACPVCTTKLKDSCRALQGAAGAAVADVPVLRDPRRVTPRGREPFGLNLTAWGSSSPNTP